MKQIVSKLAKTNADSLLVCDPPTIISFLISGSSSGEPFGSISAAQSRVSVQIETVAVV